MTEQQPQATIDEIQRLILIEFRHQIPESRRAAERVWNLINARAKTLARQTTTSVLPRSEGQAEECDGGLHKNYKIHVYDTHCSVYDRNVCVYVADGGLEDAMFWIDKVERLKP